MKQRTQKYLHAILALVLSLCLITGCSLFPNSTPEAEKNTVLETTAKAAGNGSLEDPAAQPDKTALLAAQKAFDQFTENLFKQEAAQSLLTLHYTLADPESYGITDYDRTLGTALAEDTQRDMENAKQVKADLDAMDTRLLSKDQLLTYTILSSYINTLLSSDGLELYDQPLSTTLGIQSQLPILLSEYTFYKKQDIDDYLSLLSSIDTYYDSLIAFETQRAQAGLGLCDTVIDNIIRSCNAYLIDADHSFLAETFASRLNEIDGLSDQEKADYKAKNKKAIDEHFVPAYERLITGLEGLKGKGTNDKGLYYYPEGRKYYEYLVNMALQPKKAVLSDVMLETLSIIAYKQPVTKIEIEKIRGVKCDHAVSKLMEYNLVQEVGRLDAPGKPILLGTTEEFLRNFGVQGLDELPEIDPVQMEDFKAEAEEEIQLQLNL